MVKKCFMRCIIVCLFVLLCLVFSIIFTSCKKPDEEYTYLKEEYEILQNQYEILENEYNDLEKEYDIEFDYCIELEKYLDEIKIKYPRIYNEIVESD